MGLKGFFSPIYQDESKKIQPNPTHMGQVESDWKILLLLLLLLLLNWIENKNKYNKKT